MITTAKRMTSSASNNWGTPTHIIEAARAAMGSIDLDPSTTDTYNRLVVKATNYFTEETDGFLSDWVGNNVFMNCPYGKKNLTEKIYGATAWVKKAITYHNLLIDNHIDANLICVVRDSNAKFPLIQAGAMSCEPDYRIAFVDLDTGILQEHPQYITNIYYLGGRKQYFYKNFKEIGYIRSPF